MNRQLRRWHLRVVAGLAPLAAVTFAAAVLVRGTAPDNATPAQLRNPLPVGLEAMDRRLIDAAGLVVELRRLSDSTAGTGVIELTPLAEPQVADLLVYWGSGPAGTLPADGVLLGPLAGRAPIRFRLPSREAGAAGELFFYSGATREVLARADLAMDGAPAP